MKSVAGSGKEGFLRSRVQGVSGAARALRA